MATGNPNPFSTPQPNRASSQNIGNPLAQKSSMNQNADMGTFLTGVITETKASTKHMANRKGSVDLLNNSSQPYLDSPSPQSANNMMSFNFFVTQVPIDQLVMHAHSTSSAVTRQQKDRAAFKINMELNRKITQKNQQEKLERVLKTQRHLQKTSINDLKKHHKEKMDNA